MANEGLAAETISPNEGEIINKMIGLGQGKMERDYTPGEVKRDAHPKHHGAIKAEFVIEPDLPKELQVGLFKEARSYPAWIRFSSASGEVQSDAVKDMLGMAIKVIGVEGGKVLEEEKDEKTQDFLLITYPVLLVDSAKEFFHLAEAIIKKNPLKFFLNPFDLHFRSLKIAMTMARSHTSPLDARYWSTVPSLFGEGSAVKYSALPTSAKKSSMPPRKSKTYLREALKQHLSADEASFDFMVQFQTDPKKMPIENATVEWDEKVSPFRKVATVKIHKQAFDSPGQMEFCENLSFSPWHTLSEHRPLGSINRARKVIYSTLSKFRHACNDAPRQEPTGDESFE